MVKGGTFLGGEKGLPLLDDLVVQNCVKPCGKIVDKEVDYENIFENTKNSKVSNSDCQINPDMSYCVLEVQTNEFLTLQR